MYRLLKMNQREIALGGIPLLVTTRCGVAWRCASPASGNEEPEHKQHYEKPMDKVERSVGLGRTRQIGKGDIVVTLSDAVAMCSLVGWLAAWLVGRGSVGWLDGWLAG